MKKKVINIIVNIVIYYLSALLVVFIFKQFGLIKENIYLYSLMLTITWVIVQLIVKLIKKKSNK